MIRSSFLLVLSMTVAYVLMLLPLPGELSIFRPELPLMVCLYWVIALPQYNGVITGGAIGLVQDFLTSAVLGTNALCYSLICTVFLMFYQQVRMQTPGQQALMIMPLFLLMHAFQGLISGLLVGKGMPGLLDIILPTASAVLLWPWLMKELRNLRRRFNLVNRLI